VPPLEVRIAVLPYPRELKSPFLLGAVPLAMGVSIFLLWLVTEWRWLPFLGILTLYGGCGAVLLGLAMLAYWFRARIRSGDLERERLTGRAVIVGCVLLVNFPAAAGIIWMTVRIATTYTVTVQNRGAAPLRSAVVSGGGVSVRFEEISPHSIATRRFHIVHDGTLNFSGEQNGKPMAIEVEGYVTNGAGGSKVIEVASDGTIEVRDGNR
jgi:hypothetical protein